MKNTKDMTVGSVTGAIIAFSLPILFGNLFQQAYNLADTAIAGHFLGDDALSAIGATSSLFNFLMYFIGGLNGGFSLIIAKSFGSRNDEKIKKCIAATVVFNAVLTVIAMLFALTLIKPVLHLINTPDAVFDDAYKYVFIVFMGTAATACYNAQANLLRALGNSFTPIVFLIISTILNIFLDIVFIAKFNLGVMGASLATVIAQGVSCILCAVTIKINYKRFSTDKNSYRFDKALYGEMFYAGITMALMNCIFAIGSLILQGAINSLGKSVIAAHLGARKIVEIFMQPMITVSTACATFISQNYGAGKVDRIKKAIKVSISAELIMSVVFTAIVYLLATPMIRLVTDTQNEFIIATAKKYLFINLPFYVFLGILYVLRTSIQSIGRRVPPLISSAIELVTKCICAFALTGVLGYTGVCIAEPVSWTLGALLLIFSFSKAVKSLSKTLPDNA